MSHNKELKEKQDHNLVSNGDPEEIEALHQKYPHLSHELVKSAIKTYGPDRKKVEDHLNSVKK